MNNVSSLSLLAIDCKKAAKSIRCSIAATVNSQLADGVTIGLSGGVDSAVLATVAKEALGSRRVQAFYLYDRTNRLPSCRNAQLLADQLKISLVLHSIDTEMDEQRIYTPLIMRMILGSEIITRRLSKGLFGAENPFVYTLRNGDFGNNRTSKFVYKELVNPVERAFCARHIYRRKYLEKIAIEQSNIVLGAANRSEIMVGWFVKDGIDDMVHSPLSCFYKTQIYQLAKFLHIPDEIIEQTASPDMLRGVTDECAIGINYEAMDTILYGMDYGLLDEELIEAGVTREQIAYVRKLNKLSEWKRSARKNPSGSP